MKEGDCCSCNNRRMFVCISIIVLLQFLYLNRIESVHEITTCEEFETGAQFNPKDVVDSMWKIFYFRSNTTEVNPIIFTLPSEKRMKRIKDVVDAIDSKLGVQWHKVALLMEPRPGVTVVLMDAGTPGAFRALVKQEQRHKARPNPEPLIKFADIRLKTKGRYMGMMCCEDLTAFALARLEEMPKTEQECETAAATLGLKGPDGRSYFYLNKKQTDNEL